MSVDDARCAGDAVEEVEGYPCDEEWVDPGPVDPECYEVYEEAEDMLDYEELVESKRKTS